MRATRRLTQVPRLECGSTDRPNHGWASRRRVPAYAPPCASLRVPAKRGRVEYANAMASSRPPAGSPEDVPNTRSTDGAARQGGTIARCSFVVTVKLFRLFPYELRIPIRLHPRLNPSAIRPASVEYPCWCSCSQSPASAGSSRAARQRHPHVVPSVRRAGDFFPEVRQGVSAVKFTPPWRDQGRRYSVE